MSLLIRTAWACLPVLLCAQSSFDIALIGDVPYGTANEPRYERMIADINRSNVDFTVHIGDTKSGSTRCDEAHYLKTLDWFNSFDQAVLYTPGDNEWTDCMRNNNGSFDPLDRLALVRKTYFGNSMSLGRRPIPLMRQSDEPQYAAYVENRMLVKSPVVLVTIHVVGSNNNLEYKSVQGAPNRFYDQDREYAARNAANIAWLRKAFQTARDSGLLGVMILVQANLFESFMEASVGNTSSGYSEFIAALRQETQRFRGDVVLVSGDSHYMRVDKPLTDRWPACTLPQGECKPFEPAIDARGERVLNFTRVEVPGSGDVHWVMAHIRPGSRNIFQFEFMTVPAVASTGVTAVASALGSRIGTDAIETQSRQLRLSALDSTSTNSGELTYSWSSEPGYPVPAMTGGDTATPTLQFSVTGTYRMILKVTDRTGAAGTASLNIRYQ